MEFLRDLLAAVVPEGCRCIGEQRLGWKGSLAWVGPSLPLVRAAFSGVCAASESRLSSSVAAAFAFRFQPGDSPKTPFRAASSGER